MGQYFEKPCPPQTLLRTLMSAALALVVSSGCAQQHPGVLSPEEPAAPNTSTLSAFADSTRVTAGEETTVRCLEVQGQGYGTPALPTRVVLNPEPAGAIHEDHRVRFASDSVGSIAAHCQYVDVPDEVSPEITVEIVGRLPWGWEVQVPQTTCLSGTEYLNIPHRVFDALGNTVSNAQVLATITPNIGIIGNLNTGFRFTEDGQYQVRLEVASTLDPQSTISPVEFSINVDATPPLIDFVGPTRGAMLRQDTVGETRVWGSVSDSTSDIAFFQLNGVDMTPGTGTSSMSFDTTMAAPRGLSVVSARAQDTCGNVTFATVPFLLSEDFYPAATQASTIAQVDSAFYGQLAQEFIDDGDRADVDDLATLFNRFMDTVDLNTEFPAGTVLAENEPLPTQCGFYEDAVYVYFRARRHSDSTRRFEIDGPYVDEVAFKDGGLGFDISAGAFSLPLNIRVEVLQCTLGSEQFDSFDVDGKVAFDGARAVGLWGMDVAGSWAVTDVVDFDLNVDGGSLDFECGAFDWACDMVSNSLFNAGLDYGIGTLDKLVHEQLPGIMNNVFTGFGVESSLTVQSGFSMQLNTHASLQTLAFCGPDMGLARPALCTDAHSNAGSAGLGLGLQFYPSQRGIGVPFDAQGAIRSPDAPLPVFDPYETSFGLSVHTDIINQLFWALWYGGAMTLPDVGRLLRGALPESLDGAILGSFEATMPPVLMPGGEDHLVKLGLGGMMLRGNVNMTQVMALLGGGEDLPGIGAGDQWVEIDVLVSGSMGITLEFDSESERLVFGTRAVPEIYFEILRVDNAHWGSYLGQALGEILTDVMADHLAAAIGQVDLPSFDVSGLVNADGHSEWALSQASMVQRDGYVQLSGALEVR